MRPLLPALLLAAACAAPRPSAPARDAARPATFANPLDLDYRLMPDSGPSWRQAADPIVVPWGDEYLLLASQSGGYWRTRDFRRFALVVPTGLPLEQPAPALLSLGGRLYYTAHKLRAMYATDDPLGGRWERVADMESYADPMLFRDADAPHAYHQLDRPARARHVRVTNVHAAAGARFAVRDLRVFGEAPVPLPAEVAGLAVRRDPDDDRAATLRWERSAGARSYVVRFGVAPEKLYGSWEVGDTTALTMRGLNRGVPYWFVVDAVNERGVARGRVARRG